MSSDPEAIRTMEEDPLNSQGNVRARTANEMLKAFGHVAQQEGQLVLPIYAHHGGEDRLANLRVCPLSAVTGMWCVALVWHTQTLRVAAAAVS